MSSGREPTGGIPAGLVSDGGGGPMVEVQLPVELSADAQLGKAVFDAICADCHGENAAGRHGVGPPLVHKIYEPGHHGDMAFQLAVRTGVRAHHWSFGSMPPVEGVSDSEIARVTLYIRELQRENGID
nr:cytochrome c [Tropicimonas sediminicola]